MARMFAAGMGDRSARIKASSEANWSAWGNVIGCNNFTDRLASTVGSCCVVRRIWVMVGSSFGIKGEMLYSKRGLEAVKIVEHDSLL